MSGRHTAAGRRPVSFVLLTATALGLWFGIRAPEVSPVAPTDPVVQVQIMDDDDGPGPRGGRR